MEKKHELPDTPFREWHEPSSAYYNLKQGGQKVTIKSPIIRDKDGNPEKYFEKKKHRENKEPKEWPQPKH